MRVVAQRVTRGRVTVGGEVVGSIGVGLVVLVGVARGDTDEDAGAVVDKIAGLRIFSDDDGRMNLSVSDVGGSVLLVSQFTLLADVRKGRRPGFSNAASPPEAEPLIDWMAERLRGGGIPVETGRFGASMDVELTNAGPVTIVIETRDGRLL